MRLILSTRHPRNSTYSTETGKILYKVDKPLKLGHSVATIRKAVDTVNGVWLGDTKLSAPRAKSPFSDPETSEKEDHFPDSDRRSLGSDDQAFADSDSEDEGGPSARNLPALQDQFAFYAQIEFHTFNSTRFRYNSRDVPVSEYFRKEGWSWYGRGRVFTASNGKEYRWELRAGHLEMVTNDSSKTKVVRFREHRLGLGPIMKARPGSLEIDPSCEPILDEIIMTFIYCHKLRKDRERSQRNAAGSGGAA